MTRLEKFIKSGGLFILSPILFCASSFAEPSGDLVEPPVSNAQQSKKEYPIEEPEVSTQVNEPNKNDDNNESIPKPTRRRSGFIIKNIAKSGYIIKSFKPDTMLGNGEIVYVKKDRLEELKIGQRYTLFSAKQKVLPPKVVNDELFDLELKPYDRTSDAYYMAANDVELNLTKPIKKIFKLNEKTVGFLVKKLGTIEILEKGQFAHKAIIRQAFAPIKTGDRFISETSQSFSTMREKNIDAENFEGVIMAFSKIGTLGSKNDIIMIDKGSEDGLITGDRLDIFVKPQKKQSSGLKFWQNIDITLPSEVIGKIQILSTKETTATAIILSNRREILLGQRVRLPKLASFESISESEEKTVDSTKP
jgi:hypothetical protein